MHNSFTTGAKVYLHLCGPSGKHLLHAAKMQPGLAKLPSNNAKKCQLLDTLLTLIDSNHHNAYVMPGPAAKPEVSAIDDQVAAAADRPPTPQPHDTLTGSVMLPRTLVFDGSSIDSAGVSALTGVCLDGYMGFPPFIKYFPVPTQFDLPGQFRPTEERHPRWEASKLADQWIKRRDLAFEVCIQAAALCSAVNSSAIEFETNRKEAARSSKQKYQQCEVSIDMRTADKQEERLPPPESCHPECNVQGYAGWQAGRSGSQKQE